MLRVFADSDRAPFTSNGDYVLSPLRAEVTNQLNGDYYIEVELRTREYQFLSEGCLIVADTPHGTQAFRVLDTDTSLDGVTVKAWHVSRDAQNIFVADTFIQGKTGYGALLQLKNMATQDLFTVASNIGAVDNLRVVRDSLWTAWQSVMERWGGYLVFDNWNVQLLSDVGRDTEEILRYGKNLKELQRETSWGNVVTQICPVGKNETMLDTVNPNASIYLFAQKQYAIPFTKTVTFSQDHILEDGFKVNGTLNETAYKRALVADLRSQALQYLDEHDAPEVSYTVSANIGLEVNIGDKLMVRDETLDVDRWVRVVGTKYDCLLDRYSEVVLGVLPPSLSDIGKIVAQS